MRREDSRSWLWLGGILLLFVLLGIAFSLVVPAFETPDELFHYAFARHLAQGNPLPVQGPDSEDAPWAQEGSQAPLYYWLLGRLTAGIDQSDFERFAVRNPRANIGDPLYPGNKNFMLFSAAQPPLTGLNLALHVGRWFSLALGVLTLVFIYLTARLAFPDSTFLPLVSTATVAAIPQFVFLSAAVTNDMMIVATVAAAVYWLARLVARPPSVPISLFEWFVLGVLLALAALSKLHGLGLVGLAGLAVLGMAWMRRDWRLPLRALLPVALPVLLIAGPWYWRNYTLYGDPLGVVHLLEVNGRRGRPLSWGSFWPEFRGLRYSTWGLFGWFNIMLPLPIYRVLDLVSLVALAGLVGVLVQTIRGKAPGIGSPAGRVRLLLLTWALLSCGLILYWTSQATGSQGRLLFPGLGALVVLLTLGLAFWIQPLPVRLGRAALLALPVFLLAVSLLALVVLLPRAYRAPRPMAALPETARPMEVLYGEAGGMRLAGIETPDDRFEPGDEIPITLYWQTERPLAHDYELFVQLLDEEGRELGNVTSHPGWGRNPTTLWEPGAIYPDPYRVRIERRIDEHSPLLADVYVGFVDPASGGDRLPLPARSAAGGEIKPFLAKVTIAPWHRPEVETLRLKPAQTRFGDRIDLIGFDLAPAPPLGESGVLTVTLLWEAVGTPAGDSTAFVHLIDGAGSRVAGYDQAPAGVRFPTHAWRAGDRVLSEFPVALPAERPAGPYTVWVGLYDSASQGALRLPVTDAGGLPSGDGQVQVGAVD